jgi:hypothetical protein
MSFELKPPGQAFDASTTMTLRAVSPHSLVLGPQLYAQVAPRGPFSVKAPLPIFAFGANA